MSNQKIVKSEAEWKTCLTPEQYQVMREKGTEAAFTGKYYKTKDKGMYLCAACGAELFSSENKFDSGTGWPSFDKPVLQETVEEIADDAHGMHRVEVVCSRCGAHLGHVFNDGPAETTGQRFCINSASLKLKKEDGEVV